MRALDRAPGDVNSIVGPHPSRVTPPASAIATRAAPAFSLLESAQLLAEAIRSFTERCACGIRAERQAHQAAPRQLAPAGDRAQPAHRL